jgi:outer membrane protein TolC
MTTFLLLLPLLLPAGDTLHLEDAYRRAEEKFPLAGNIALQRQMYELKSDNLTAQYLPSLSLAAQATYQSETIELPLPAGFPISIPEPYNDQYSVTLLLNQLIYDGGTVSAQRDMDAARRRVDEQSVEVQMYALRQQINEAYFSLLLLQEREKSLDILEREIKEKLDVLNSRVRNGVVLRGSVDALSAELLKLRQNRRDVTAGKRSALDALSGLLNEKLDEGTMLALPDVLTPEDSTVQNRPEYVLYEATREQIAESAKLVDTKYLPRVAGFVQASYARPGVNPFGREFEFYYIAGLRLNWAPWDWKVGSREKEILSLQQRAVENQRDAFVSQTSITLDRDRNDMERLREMLRTDDEIIALRERIVQQVSSQLENGVVTATDYLTELNAASQARLDRETHHIQLVKVTINYLTTIGK